MKISVILPTFNSSLRLQQTLDSIRYQNGNGTEFTLELIVVDDCSTDNTPGILRLNGIDFLSTGKTSGGPNRGRNIGLEHATGDVICFNDHDDLWHPDKLRRQLQQIERSPIVSTGVRIQDQVRKQTMLLGEDSDAVRFYPKNEAFLKKLARDKHCLRVYPSTLMIDSSLRYIRFEETYGMVDFDWQLRLFERRPHIEIRQPLVTHYLDGNNLSLNHQYRINDYEQTLNYIEMYRNDYPATASTGYKRVNGSMARYYYLIGEMGAAREYFKKSVWDMKTILYYFTSYYGNILVKKHFRVFG